MQKVTVSQLASNTSRRCQMKSSNIKAQEMLSKRFLSEAELIKNSFREVVNFKAGTEQRGHKPVGEGRGVLEKER